MSHRKPSRIFHDGMIAIPLGDGMYDLRRGPEHTDGEETPFCLFKVDSGEWWIVERIGLHLITPDHPTARAAMMHCAKELCDVP